MGRVYEALKRAAERSNGIDNPGAATEKSGVVRTDGGKANGNGASRLPVTAAPATSAATTIGSAAHIATPPAVASNSEAEALRASLEHVVHNSTVLQSSPVITDGLPPGSTVRDDSAFNEHTEQANGSALPGSHTGSRAAGATLDAVSSTRAREFPALEIIQARVEPHLVSITDPRSPHAERFRSLRTRVLHAGERQGVQTIVVTSSGIMEGKTITALNLAWQLAEADGVRALLIDGDLRHPCAADYLALDAPTGLSEVLVGEATLEESIVRLDPAGLHLLPGGAARDDVADLLSGPRFSHVLAEARSMFDFIILDAPPLGIFTDAAVLMNRADGALLVIRAGRVRYTQLDRLLEGLPQERILGVVMNGANEQLDESNYYYYRRDRRARQAEAEESSGAHRVETEPLDREPLDTEGTKE